MNSLLDYTFIWNVLHYPSGVLPVTQVEQGEDSSYEDGYNDIWTKTIRKDLQGNEGMPLCVQVVGLSFEDETVLGVMKSIEDGIKARSK